MLNKLLYGLAQLFFESELRQELDLEAVVQNFIGKNKEN